MRWIKSCPTALGVIGLTDLPKSGTPGTPNSDRPAWEKSIKRPGNTLSDMSLSKTSTTKLFAEKSFVELSTKIQQAAVFFEPDNVTFLG